MQSVSDLFHVQRQVRPGCIVGRDLDHVEELAGTEGKLWTIPIGKDNWRMNQMESFWPFFKGQYKVHCRNRSHAKQIGFWSGCVRDAVYFYPDGHVEEDVVIPDRQLKRAQFLIKRTTQPEKSENALVVTQ